jgi:DNA-binding MarR family transcriptional regulator
MRKTNPPIIAPAPGEGNRGADGHLGYLLRQADVAFRARMERALADLGVTRPQYAVLTMVKAYPGLSNADLARLSLLTPQTMSTIVANLRRGGLLASRPHAVHGRIRQLALTEAGESALKRCRVRVDALEKQLAAGLSAQEERAVRRWLARIAVEHAGGAGKERR